MSLSPSPEFSVSRAGPAECKREVLSGDTSISRTPASGGTGALPMTWDGFGHYNNIWQSSVRPQHLLHLGTLLLGLHQAEPCIQEEGKLN